jgi:hypothetical protein
MRESRKLTHEEVDKITYHISSLSQEERQLVRQHIYDILARTGGIIYRESFHQELEKLRHGDAISDIDLHGIEHAFLEE